MQEKDALTQIEDATGGSATLHELKDSEGNVIHSFATLSMPLRPTHWIYQKGDDGFCAPPPMPLRIGSEGNISITITEVDAEKNPGWVNSRTITIKNRRQMADLIRAAGKYAVRSATMHGSEMDFDPDALLQNLVVGFLGYWTATGLGGEPHEDPPFPWKPTPDAPSNPCAPAMANEAE